MQFPYNSTIYKAGAIDIPDSNLSFLDWLLFKREELDSIIRRFQSPDEYPFFPEAVKTPILKPLHYPRILHKNDVNVNEKIRKTYLETFLPKACANFGRQDRGETEENYGSSATADINCLQAISRRIHFGKFVAESKFQTETERFTKLIKEEDRKGIDEAITNAKVEQQVLDRLQLKATTYGRDPASSAESPGKISADAVVTMYKDFIIPLTKEVEVEYLMQRLEPEES